MKIEVKLEKNLQEPYLVLHTNELTPELANLLGSLAEPNNFGLVAYTDTGLTLLNPEDIFWVRSEGNLVFAATETATYRLKMRLYEAEEKLAGKKIIRISSSELANFSHVKSLDMSFSGTIRLEFSGGQHSFVSRRYVQGIKKMLGI